MTKLGLGVGLERGWWREQACALSGPGDEDRDQSSSQPLCQVVVLPSTPCN